MSRPLQGSFFFSRRHLGLTLVELMVTLSVLAILSALAIPSFNSMLDATASEEQSRELVRVINYARTEAIRRNQAVSIQPRGASAGSADWKKELIVFINTDRTGASLYQADRTILRQHYPQRISPASITPEAFTPGSSGSSSVSLLSFAASGMLASSQEAIRFKICGDNKHRSVTIYRSGLIDSEEIESCGGGI